MQLYLLKKFTQTIPIFFGVTFLSFLLMVYFGSDASYSLIGKNASLEDLENLRQQLGHNKTLLQRYCEYLYETLHFDFGHSQITQENVMTILKRAIPVSVLVNLPGFIIGNTLAVFASLYAAYYKDTVFDKIIRMTSSFGMSLSFIIVIIALQSLLCSRSGLNLFPVQGWSTETFALYTKYVCVPTLASMFVSFAYNTRFFRALMVEEMGKTYVKTCTSLGWSPFKIMTGAVLRNVSIPMFTRLIFSVPFIFVEGSLLLESFFGIPGMGAVTYNAVMSGDIPVLKAIVCISSFLYMGVLILSDLISQWIDPRVQVY